MNNEVLGNFMSSDDTKALWQKSHELESKVHQLIKDQAVQSHQMKSIEEKITRYTEECSRGHAELKIILDGYSKNVQTVLESHHQRQGVRSAMQWSIPVIISLAMFILTLLALIKGGGITT